MTGRRRHRKRLAAQVTEHIGQLARSSPHQQDVASLQTIPDTFARIDSREAVRLAQTIERLLGIARRIETDLAAFREALEFQARFDLGAQDAIILAAVVADLRTRSEPGPHYFANRNRKDFSDPGIQAELLLFDCRTVFSFAEVTGLLGPTGHG